MRYSRTRMRKVKISGTENGNRKHIQVETEREEYREPESKHEENDNATQNGQTQEQHTANYSREANDGA